MREIVRRSLGMPQDLRLIEDCYLNNLDAPVVRTGGEWMRLTSGSSKSPR
jgi:hypothetical protein